MNSEMVYWYNQISVPHSSTDATPQFVCKLILQAVYLKVWRVFQHYDKLRGSTGGLVDWG